MTQHRRVGVAAAFVAAATLVSVGVVVVRAGLSAGPSAPPAPLPAAQFTVSAGSAAGPAVQLSARAGHHCPPDRSGAQVLVPDLCIQAPATPVGLQQDGSMSIPRDLHRVGFWDGGAGLSGTSDPRGTTVVAGHVNELNEGEGAFYRLSDITPDELILTRDGAGRVSRWKAVSLRVVDKWALPSDLFVGHDGPRRLVLVTCGGEVLHVPGHGNVYAKNVIVTAVPDLPARSHPSSPAANPTGKERPR